MRWVALWACALAVVTSATIGCSGYGEAPEAFDPPEPTEDGTGDRPSKRDEGARLEAPTPAAETPEPAADPAATPAATCDEAREIGTLSGDTGKDKLTFEGKCSEWVRVRVTEGSESAIAAAQRVTVTLVPPTGSDFELRAYVDKEADRPACAEPAAASDIEGDKVETLRLTWGEEFSGNNADDSRTVTIEVKSKDGSCAKQTWTLLVQGNQ